MIKILDLFKRKKDFSVNGWTYSYVGTAIQITNPQGQNIGRPVPLPKIPIGKKRSGYDWFING